MQGALIKKIEPILFWLAVAMLILPIWQLQWFSTIDGPAHVYNAVIIKEKLFGNTPVFDFLFSFNPFPEPNWASHLLLVIFLFFLQPGYAEILLVSLILFVFLFGARKFVLSFSGAGPWAAWILLPAAHSFILYLGFYNFCLGLGLLFFILVRANRSHDSSNDAKGMIIMALLFTGLYFCHAMLFLIGLGSTLFLQLAQCNFSPAFFLRSTNWRKTMLQSAIPLMLTMAFLATKSGISRNVYIPLQEKILWLRESRFLIGFVYEGQVFPAKIYFYLTVILLLSAGGKIVASFKNKQQGTRIPFAWLLLSMMILLMYFLLPDELASGGYLSVRLLMLFFLLFLPAISFFSFPLLVPPAALVSVILAFTLSSEHLRHEKVLNEEVNEYMEIASGIKPNSLVLPLNHSGNWIHSNFSCRLGAAIKTGILDNYEASTPHFPLRWKKGTEPYSLLGDYAQSYHPCIDLNPFEDSTGKKIDYVVRWKFNENAPPDSCDLITNALLEKEFSADLSSRGKGAVLLKRK